MTDLNDTAAYDYAFDDALIAAWPLERRSDARMLVVRDDALEDRVVCELAELLDDRDLLVLNDAKVSPVRLRARRASGGAVEIFVLGTTAEGLWAPMTRQVCALLRSNRRVRDDEVLTIEPTGRSIRCVRRVAGGVVEFSFDEDVDVFALLDEAGAVPLPPYIVQQRAAETPALVDDRVRYQTVFARVPGAVAAPTAGLHFDDAALAAFAARGVRRASVTLMVGVGTFRPVATQQLDQHEMHEELYAIPSATREAIAETRRRGGRVVAVGTTVVRALEADALEPDEPQTEGMRSTRLFLRPGSEFSVVDALLTNFHLPQSTLITLVSAFAGYEATMAAYRHAVEARYRFYSYGDAMFIPTRAPRGA